MSNKIWNKGWSTCFERVILTAFGDISAKLIKDSSVSVSVRNEDARKSDIFIITHDAGLSITMDTLVKISKQEYVKLHRFANVYSDEPINIRGALRKAFKLEIGDTIHEEGMLGKNVPISVKRKYTEEFSVELIEDKYLNVSVYGFAFTVTEESELWRIAKDFGYFNYIKKESNND